MLQKSCRASTSGSGSRASSVSPSECFRDSRMRSPPAVNTTVDDSCLSCKMSFLLQVICSYIFAHLRDGSNTSWSLPTSFLAVQTEPTLMKFLLSLVVRTECSAIPCVSVLRDVDLSRFQFSFSQSKNSKVTVFMDFGFSSGRMNFLRFLCVC